MGINKISPWYKKVLNNLKLNGLKFTFNFIKIEIKKKLIKYINHNKKYSNRYYKQIAEFYNKILINSTEKSTTHVLYRPYKITITNKDVKCIAFYLPQFHPIPENDKWWGKGFTEWTNVSKSVPQFIGHYQPHLPDELGFYDLRVPEIIETQVKLAKNYGIYGFCFYYYWFNGNCLLDLPLKTFVHNKNLNFPFCICWANENWTRTWDGRENDILIEQKHSATDDINFIRSLIPYILEKKYIRVYGKPLIIIYRPSSLPDPEGTAIIWREFCRKNGVGEIYLAYTMSFDSVSPDNIGFDAAIEFPPNNTNYIKITDEFTIINKNFSGEVFDYEELAKNYYKRKPVKYDLFKGAIPSWDNSARRPGRGTVFHGSSPKNFKKWLDENFKYTLKNISPDKRFIFINAWNEWAEGAHLEPDRKYGFGYLEVIKDVILKYK